MGLVIRMRQQGRKNHRTFRLVVADRRSPRDGKFLEILGFYDPHAKEDNLRVKSDRVDHWVQLGAQFSPRTARLMSHFVHPSHENELSRKSRSDKGAPLLKEKFPKGSDKKK